MKNGAGAARLICVFTVCILLLGYNFYGRLLKTPAVQAVKPVSEKREIESYQNSSSAPRRNGEKGRNGVGRQHLLCRRGKCKIGDKRSRRSQGYGKRKNNQ